MAVIGVIGYLAAWPPAPNGPASRQTVLPFTGLDWPNGVAVDSAGAVYVADQYNSQVVKLAAG